MTITTRNILAAAGAVIVGVAALLHGSASALPVGGDEPLVGTDSSVIGVFTTDGGADTFVIDATAHPSGTDARGNVYGGEGHLGDGGVFTLERVICLVAEGNRATVGTQILRTNIESTPSGTYQVYSFVDGVPDLVGGGWAGTTEPTCEIDHSDPPAGYGPIANGDFEVTAGQLLP